MKVYASIELHLAYHVDSISLADGSYQLILEPEGGCSEDPKDFIREFSEGPNQSSEDVDLLTSDPPVKASPGHIPLLYLHCNLCLSILYLALSLGIEVKP
jgi:hypothetical protein